MAITNNSNSHGIQVSNDAAMVVQSTIGHTIGVLAIVLNLIVIIVFKNSSQLVSRNLRVLIMNQSVIDLCCGIWLIVYQHNTYTLGYYIGHQGDAWYLASPQAYCRLIYSAYLLWGSYSAYTTNLIIIITIERYISVAHPAWHHAHLHSRRRLLNVLVPLASLLGYSQESFVAVDNAYYPETGMCMMWQTKTQLHKLLLALFSLCYLVLLPLILISYCYGRTMFVLLKRSSLQQGNPTEMTGTGGARAIDKVKLERI